jgi:hypothetical protein
LPGGVNAQVGPACEPAGSEFHSESIRIVDPYIHMAITASVNPAAVKFHRYIPQIVCPATVSLARPPASMHRVVRQRRRYSNRLTVYLKPNAKRKSI